VNYHVLYQAPAEDELTEIGQWIARRSPARAEAWLNGARAAIETLSSLPRRCPLAPEDDDFDVEIRQLLYREFRILFTIEGDVVRVLHVRHGARRSLTPDEPE
jgi:plasmid stabilization system protein ParE